MDQQQIENTIQFLVENQARFHSDLELMKERMNESQQRTDAQIQSLVASQQVLTERVDDVVGAVDEVAGAVDTMRLEMREAFNNLIIANEATRELASQMGKLIVNVSQRLTIVEKRLDERSE